MEAFCVEGELDDHFTISAEIDGFKNDFNFFSIPEI